ncbi:aromatic ring-hydroxylating oxygenase subunit alpha [Streptomyces syringium]|uniref:aromatic ring-hydroxylating oxygenase subunit alpha n=1 Tax=Streptomyces syringium TaxID=76729 RepID=UPI00341900D5
MDHASQVRIIEELLAFEEQRTTDMAGQDHEYHNPVSVYTDPSRFEAEVDRIWYRTPLAVGHVGEFPRAGSFKTLTVGKVPLLVVRGKDERIRAFVNVCRHRGTVLVEEPEGRANAFACPYHAWTYGQDGVLRHVPDDFGFPTVASAKDDYGLRELWCQEHAGFVYVQADGKAPERPLGDWLADVGTDLRDLGLDDFVCLDASRAPHPVNWKLPFDIFLENYHTKFTHRKTIYPVFLSNVAKFDHFGPHIRCVLPRREITELRHIDRSKWDLVEQSTILYVVWPNTMIAVLPEHAAVWHVYPDGVGHCTLHFYALLARRLHESEAEQETWKKSLKVVQKVKREDAERFLSIQRGLESGANPALTFGRYEKAISWFHQSIEEALTRDH